MKKICFVSSSGGHWEELMCLKEVAEEYDSFFITEKSGQLEEYKLSKLYVLEQINRKEKKFGRHFLRLFLKAFSIMLREKPDLVITTGALISVPFCVVAKLFRKKVVYIESFARVYNKSLTGKLLYPFADLFLVQWESLLDLYPKAKYVGGIF